MNAVFGGEGLSLATLEGNGRVILQSLTIESPANALRKAQGGDKQGPTGGLFSTNAGWPRMRASRIRAYEGGIRTHAGRTRSHAGPIHRRAADELRVPGGSELMTGHFASEEGTSWAS